MWPQLRLLVRPPWPWCTCPSVTLKLQQIVHAMSHYMYIIPRLLAEMSQTVIATGIESVVKADEMNVCEGVLCKTSAAKFTKLPSGPAGGGFFSCGHFSFLFSGSKLCRGSDSFGKGSDNLDRTRKRCSSDFWTLHLLQIVRHGECVHLQFNQFERNILLSLLEGTSRKVSFKLSFTRWCKRPERRHCANFNLVNLRSLTL